MKNRRFTSSSIVLAQIVVAALHGHAALALLPPAFHGVSVSRPGLLPPAPSSRVSFSTTNTCGDGRYNNLAKFSSFLLRASTDAMPVAENLTSNNVNAANNSELSGAGAPPISSQISVHLNNASSKNGKNDSFEQEKEVEQAERLLIQWVEDYRSERTNVEDDDQTTHNAPGAEVFNDIIMSMLALPSSFKDVPKTESGEATILGNNQTAMNDELRSLIGKGKSGNNKKGSPTILDENNKSERATLLLDLMESFHEPAGAIYDAIIASHGADALDCLSHLTNQQWSQEKGEESEVAVDQSKQAHYSQAWKSAKSALQLLNRSEDLYRETGNLSSSLPSISSYVTMMDVWKALAVSVEEWDNDEQGNVKKREEALEVVRSLRQRRLEVYSLDGRSDESEANAEDGHSRYNILPLWATESVEGVLEFATNLLRHKVPSYNPNWGRSGEESSRVGTWQFNQMIFDLAEHPQSFSGPLAQDLLEFMVMTVKKESPVVQVQKLTTTESSSIDLPIVPKPNVDTINAVLKCWMVTPGIADSARRAEAVLAQLAIWQADGTLWGVNPDIVSYNTCINCWKESGIAGAAERATDILTLLEDNSTDVSPDVITYSSCMAAWAALGAGRKAEEILLRMYQRSKDDSTSSLPKPTTRCFNAVLLAYANGKEDGRGRRALELLRFMERLDSEGYDDVKPDIYTFNIVMKALTKSGDDAASGASSLLQRMEDNNLNPDLLSYNTVLDAYAKEGDAESAEKLLNRMHARAEKGSKSGGIAKPDAYSYTSVLNAWSRHEDKTLAVQKAEELFNDLERLYAAGATDVRADTSVYNSLINCWAKSGDRKALYRVTQLLNLMEELGLQGGDSDVQPNSRTYCAVLDALARSKNWKAVNQSLEILERMEALYADGHECVRPCVRAYSIVISTIARSKKKGKAELAQEILHRMESEYRKGNEQARPTVYSYNAVLNAAAYTNGDEKEQEQAFKVACLTFDELRMSDYLRPSHVSYGTFLKAINKLMPESDVRNDLVKGLFRRCCRDGQVGDLVLRSMKSLTTPDFYQSLLEGVEDYGLPKSWSTNVSERDSALRT